MNLFQVKSHSNLIFIVTPKMSTNANLHLIEQATVTENHLSNGVRLRVCFLGVRSKNGFLSPKSNFTFWKMEAEVKKIKKWKIWFRLIEDEDESEDEEEEVVEEEKEEEEEEEKDEEH